jgi:peptidoglycan lytic transglycosylase G
MFKLYGKRIALIFTAILCLLMVVIIVGFGVFFTRPARKGGINQVITIREGMSLKEVASALKGNGIITNKDLFMLWTRLLGNSRKIKAGEYLLNSGMAPVRIIEILTRGIIITYPVTVPEGFSIEQIGDILAANGLADKKLFVSLAHEPGVIKKYGISGPSLEGFLYPDTYQFGKGLPPSLIIDVMVKRFWEIIGPYMDRIKDLKMTVEEVITLASIVEKETGTAEEMPLIASVFLNRLRNGMRMESDPTVIYGMNDFTGNLTRKDLLESTPYNTYVIRGLPPGPISNPGLASIKAVLYPAETDYLYFVSKNDGTHYFSSSIEEHNRAVWKYQKR